MSKAVWKFSKKFKCFGGVSDDASTGVPKSSLKMFLKY